MMPNLSAWVATAAFFAMTIAVGTCVVLVHLARVARDDANALARAERRWRIRAEAKADADAVWTACIEQIATEQFYELNRDN